MDHPTAHYRISGPVGSGPQRAGTGDPRSPCRTAFGHRKLATGAAASGQADQAYVNGEFRALAGGTRGAPGFLLV